MADFYQSSLFDPSAPREKLNFRKCKKLPKDNKKTSTSESVENKQKKIVSKDKNDASKYFVNVIWIMMHRFFRNQLSSYQHLEEDSILKSASSIENVIGCSSVQTEQSLSSIIEIIPSSSTSVNCPVTSQDEQNQYSSEICGRCCDGIQNGKYNRKSLKTKIQKLRINSFPGDSASSIANEKSTERIQNHMQNNQFEDKEVLVCNHIHVRKTKKKSRNSKSKRKERNLSRNYNKSKEAIKTHKKKAKKSLSQGCRYVGTGVLNMSSTVPECYGTNLRAQKYFQEQDYVYDPDNKFY